MNDRGQCTIDGCANRAHARGWCRKHYMRWWEHGDPNFATFVPAKPGEPLAFLMALPIDGSGCVTWPFATNNVGYGQVNIGNGRKVLASRISCERRNGPPPSDVHQAAHSCGKGHEGCVAPWHLDWKLPVDNAADKDEHGTVLRGEDAPWARLSEAQVRSIRLKCNDRSQSSVAAEFGISQSMVSMIVRRRVWGHVP